MYTNRWNLTKLMFLGFFLIVCSYFVFVFIFNIHKKSIETEQNSQMDIREESNLKSLKSHQTSLYKVSKIRSFCSLIILVVQLSFSTCCSRYSDFSRSSEISEVSSILGAISTKGSDTNLVCLSFGSKKKGKKQPRKGEREEIEREKRY